MRKEPAAQRYCFRNLWVLPSHLSTPQLKFFQHRGHGQVQCQHKHGRYMLILHVSHFAFNELSFFVILGKKLMSSSHVAFFIMYTLFILLLISLVL